MSDHRVHSPINPRVRRVVLQPEILVELMIDRGTDDTRKRMPIVLLDHALPVGSHYEGCAFDPVRRVVYAYVTHPSFDVVPPGDVIPEHPHTTFMQA